jgi:hypothetical protein
VSERGVYLLWDPASWKKIRVSTPHFFPVAWERSS